MKSPDTKGPSLMGQPVHNLGHERSQWVHWPKGTFGGTTGLEPVPDQKGDHGTNWFKTCPATPSPKPGTTSPRDTPNSLLHTKGTTSPQFVRGDARRRAPPPPLEPGPSRPREIHFPRLSDIPSPQWGRTDLSQAYTQRLVTTRLLDRVHDLEVHLSRLQRFQSPPVAK